MAMISKVGDDSFGRDTLANFQRQGVNCTHVGISPKATGVAPISVDSAGDNQIIVVMGANNDLSADDIENNSDICELLQSAKVVVAQLEIPHQTSLAALRVAKASANSPVTILNTAPATADLDPEFFEHVDILCPNEPEAQLLTGLSPGSDTWHADMANMLHKKLADPGNFFSFHYIIEIDAFDGNILARYKIYRKKREFNTFMLTRLRRQTRGTHYGQKRSVVGARAVRRPDIAQTFSCDRRHGHRHCRSRRCFCWCHGRLYCG